jgi:glycosyltransferase involved in cell wall biosynthesis
LGILYQNSLAFIYPSLSEGFGLPGMEAIQAGTLVLASDIPVFQEVYKDNVLYFNPLDFSSIKKTIKNAMSMGKSNREKRISKAQSFIKKYSWTKMAKKTLETYEDSAFIRQSK